MRYLVVGRRISGVMVVWGICLLGGISGLWVCRFVYVSGCLFVSLVVWKLLDLLICSLLILFWVLVCFVRCVLLIWWFD